jgi:hypothetical protein
VSQVITLDDMRRIILTMPKDLRELLKERRGSFLGGGAIRSIICGEELSDWDLFGPDKDSLKTWAKVLVADRSPGARLYTTDNAYTVLSGNRKPVQFISRWVYTGPEQLAYDFDFTICSAVIWWNGTSWHSTCHPYFYGDLAARRLRYMEPSREEDAGASILRVNKFLKRGYSISPDEMGKVLARFVMKVRDSSLTADVAGIKKVVIGLLREVDPLTVIEGLEARDGVADPLVSDFDMQPEIDA